MKSYEVIRQAVDEPGVKAVAAALKVSPALVYKWCEQPAEADEIRQKWEDLKACVERFVIACEKGVYHPIKKKA